jgi:hypothetical protein
MLGSGFQTLKPARSIEMKRLPHVTTLILVGKYIRGCGSVRKSVECLEDASDLEPRAEQSKSHRALAKS